MPPSLSAIGTLSRHHAFSRSGIVDLCNRFPAAFLCDLDAPVYDASARR